MKGGVVDRGRQGISEEKEKRGGKAWQERKAQTAAVRKARRAVEKIERKIHQAEQQKELLERQIADAFTKGENEEGMELSRQLDELAAKVESLYRQWEQADKDFNEVERSINELGD